MDIILSFPKSSIHYLYLPRKLCNIDEKKDTLYYNYNNNPLSTISIYLETIQRK